MISALYARKQIKEAVKVKDTARLYSIVGLDPDQPENPADMVSAGDYHTLLETIADSEWPDLRFHMRVCAGMRCEDFGAFGLAFKAAPTLRHAFQRLGRYTRLHNQVSTFSYVDRDGIFCWTHEKPCSDRLGAQLANEAAMATTLTLSRENTMQGLTPLRVQFAHERGGSTEALAEHFGIEPVFGAEIDGMQFALEDVDRATSVGDPAIWKFFNDHLETTLPATGEAEPVLEAQVVEEITKLLSGGVPQLSEVAAALAMGPRTLQRRLSDQGKTYQELVNDARRQLAQQLVSETRYSLSEIAFLTGFSEQSAFTRAFKRWSGQTPGAYRSSAP
ncbi:AraC family transcriptional regulator ligand-binding domain-containing protein [Thalassovita mangrovi]|uniref:Helix-turn-helix domain-containing protein n=1 Tax=Thalassovita mangrovi TaxID=2692236 RepID=A0A6L8LS29_9RHOB|nr:helix-turn-helix domain-containing protein [Thalassovita mangrovi]